MTVKNILITINPTPPYTGKAAISKTSVSPLITTLIEIPKRIVIRIPIPPATKPDLRSNQIKAFICIYPTSCFLKIF